MIDGVPANRDQTNESHRSRLAATFVLTVLAIGCLFLWIGTPILCLAIAGAVAGSAGAQLPIALALIVPAMFVVAMGLAWINDLYMRMTGGEIQESEGLPYRRHGPLEPMLAICFALALVALFVWFFIFAENPSRGVFG